MKNNDSETTEEIRKTEAEEKASLKKAIDEKDRQLEKARQVIKDKEEEIHKLVAEDLALDDLPAPNVDEDDELRYKITYIGKHVIKEAFSLKADTADYNIISDRIRSGGKVTGTNLSILICAIIIASVGLNMNATAVIIGAMLISPLMGTLILMGFSVASSDANNFKKAFLGFLFQVFIALLTSTLYFLLSPIHTATPEILARTQPSVWDVLIATFGGLAGAIATTRKEAHGNVIPGVAIATALMPPLCTCGFSLANGHWSMLAGAAFLFIINTFFIFLSSTIVLMILEVPQVNDASLEFRKKMRKSMIRNAIIILIPTIIFTFVITKNTNAEDASDATRVSPDTISTAKMTKEAQILFPEIDSIQIGQMERVNDRNKVVRENLVLVRLKENLSEDKEAKLNQWINTAYDEDYTIIYQLSSDLEKQKEEQKRKQIEEEIEKQLAEKKKAEQLKKEKEKEKDKATESVEKDEAEIVDAA